MDFKPARSVQTAYGMEKEGRGGYLKGLGSVSIKNAMKKGGIEIWVHMRYVQ